MKIGFVTEIKKIANKFKGYNKIINIKNKITL